MIQKQQDVITKLSSGSGSGNGGHNTNSNNNITNNITNNIALNNFRREDVEFITPEMMNALIQKPHTMIPRFIQLVHFNDNVPEIIIYAIQIKTKICWLFSLIKIGNMPIKMN